MERAAIKSLYPRCNVTITHDSNEWFVLLPHIKEMIEELVHIALSNTSIGKAVKQCEVSVILSTDDVLRALNKEYRDKDKPTNVLSFPSYVLMPDAYDALLEIKEQEIVLGDVLLALETIQKEAEEQDIALNEHVAHLMVHGILHLLGYDHMEEEEAVNMERLEGRILKQYGLSDPYEVTEN